MTSETNLKIIQAAEKRMRNGGFHAFSFRDIAGDVGVKSASVHHHFSTKEDLAAAVTHAYTDRFMAALGDPDDNARHPDDLLALYVGLFRHALIQDGMVCLCGVLASEMPALPQKVNAETRRFFEVNVNWLATVLSRKSGNHSAGETRSKALALVAGLEGAMLLASSLQDAAIFDVISERAVKQAGG